MNTMLKMGCNISYSPVTFKHLIGGVIIYKQRRYLYFIIAFAIICVLTTACNATKPEKSETNLSEASVDTITHKPKILFQDTFDTIHESWKTEGGSMKVENGVATLNGITTQSKLEHSYVWVDGIGSDLTAWAKFRIIDMASDKEGRVGLVTHCKGGGDNDNKWAALLSSGKFKLLHEWVAWVAEVPFTYEKDTDYIMKLMVIDNKLSAKVWKDGENEPVKWMVESIFPSQQNEKGLGFYFANAVVELDEITAVENSDLPVELVFGRVKPGNVFISGETPSIKIKINADKNKSITGIYAIKYEVLDYLGSNVFSGTKEVALEPEKDYEETLTLDMLTRLGQYTVDCTLISEDSVIDMKTTSIALIPKVTEGSIKESRFGMGAYGSFLGERFNKDKLGDSYAMIEKLGVKWTREELFWSKLKPGKIGSYNWQVFDSNVINARQHRINILGLIDYWATWSNPLGKNPNTSWSSALDNIRQYAADIVKRYKPNGDLAKEQGWDDGYGISTWEIWNEPDTHIYWEGDAQQFGEMVKAVSEGIKSSDPDAFIISSTSWAPQFNFNTTVMDTAGKNAYHGVAIHSYVTTPEAGGIFEGENIRFRKWLMRKEASDKQVWMTEMGYNTVNANTEVEQANYIVRANILGIASGLDKVFTFTFNYNNPAEGWGVVDESLNPKPSYAAYAAMTRQLESAKAVKRLTLLGSIHAVIFERGQDIITALWSVNSGYAINISITDGVSSDIFDIMGNEIGKFTGKFTANCSQSPIYIVSSGLTASQMEEALKAGAKK